MRALLLFGTVLVIFSFRATAICEGECVSKEREEADRRSAKKITSQNTKQQEINAASRSGTRLVDPKKGTPTVPVNEDASNDGADSLQHGESLQNSQQTPATTAASNSDATVIASAIHQAIMDLTNLDVIEEMIASNYVDLDQNDLNELIKDIQEVQGNASYQKETYYDPVIGAIKGSANSEIEGSRYELLYYVGLNLKKADAILQKLYCLRVKTCFPQTPPLYALDTTSRFPKISTSALKAPAGGKRKKASQVGRLPSINENSRNL